MKSIFVFMLALISITAQAQFRQTKNPGIIKYDFNNYSGKPILKGWLFSDSTYRKLYYSYEAADSVIDYYKQQSENIKQTESTFRLTTAAWKDKSKADSVHIAKQDKSFQDLVVELNKSTALSTTAIDEAKHRVPVITVVEISAACAVLGLITGFLIGAAK